MMASRWRLISLLLATVSASVIPVGCGGGVTKGEAAARLQQMVDDTRMVIELPDAEIEDRWDSDSRLS